MTEIELSGEERLVLYTLLVDKIRNLPREESEARPNLEKLKERIWWGHDRA